MPKLDLGTDAPPWAFQLLTNITEQIEKSHQKLFDQIVRVNTISE